MIVCLMLLLGHDAILAAKPKSPVVAATPEQIWEDSRSMAELTRLATAKKWPQLEAALQAAPARPPRDEFENLLLLKLAKQACEAKESRIVSRLSELGLQKAELSCLGRWDNWDGFTARYGHQGPVPQSVVSFEKA